MDINMISIKFKSEKRIRGGLKTDRQKLDILRVVELFERSGHDGFKQTIN